MEKEPTHEMEAGATSCALAPATATRAATATTASLANMFAVCSDVLMTRVVVIE